MTIDEKYNNAIQILHGYYDGKNERLRIASSVLKKNDFDTDLLGEFVSMICRRLGREGILKESPFTFLPSFEGIRDRERYQQLNRKMEMANLSFAEVKEIQSEIFSMDRIIIFVVDGKKLEEAYKNIKTISGRNADHDADRKAPLMKRPITGKSPRPVIRLITKHPDDGDYFRQDKRIKVNKRTLYYDVFDILFLESDQDGFLSYEQIENYLVKRKHPHIEDGGKRNKRIQNAILNEQQGFFRHAKIGSSVMKNKILDGRPLIEAARGNGLQLNNPS
jgi:hypothetical protein